MDKGMLQETHTPGSFSHNTYIHTNIVVKKEQQLNFSTMFLGREGRYFFWGGGRGSDQQKRIQGVAMKYTMYITYRRMY